MEETPNSRSPRSQSARRWRRRRSLYAHYITYIDPTSFTVMESILIISMVITVGRAAHGGRWWVRWCY